MKKLVIAAAVLGAFAGTAQAQSSVTLFGVIDTNISHISVGSGGTGRLFMDTSGINSSRLGFRGTEDLGGGLHAGFWLEAGFNSDNGTGAATNTNNQATGTSAATAGTQGLTFNRRSTVSLLGDSWGELRFGRDYTPTFWNLANLDPFGYNGVGEINNLALSGNGITGVRSSNGASYLTPNTLGGFFLQATHSFGENVQNSVGGAGALADQQNSTDGTYNGVNVGYQNGPIYFGLSTAKTQYIQTALPFTPPAGEAASITSLYGTGGDQTVTNVGGSYDFGFIKPDLLFQTTKQNSPVAQKYNFWHAGLVVPAGVGQFRFSYNHSKLESSNTNANQVAAGYVYFLSKRTALYVQAARITNKGLAAYNAGYAPPAPESGLQQNVSSEQIGLRVTF